MPVYLDIFEPLFAVTVDPGRDLRLFCMMLQMSGFDSVDDESKLESKLDKEYPKACALARVLLTFILSSGPYFSLTFAHFLSARPRCLDKRGQPSLRLLHVLHVGEHSLAESAAKTEGP